MRFAANAVRIQLDALANNLANASARWRSSRPLRPGHSPLSTRYRPKKADRPMPAGANARLIAYADGTGIDRNSA
jgi:hypothetical protein